MYHQLKVSVTRYRPNQLEASMEPANQIKYQLVVQKDQVDQHTLIMLILLHQIDRVDQVDRVDQPNQLDRLEYPLTNYHLLN